MVQRPSPLPKNAFKIMQMFRINLFFDTLNAFLINVPVLIFIQSHMHNLIINLSI